jgi:hypothetical protein
VYSWRPRQESNLQSSLRTTSVFTAAHALSASSRSWSGLYLNHSRHGLRLRLSSLYTFLQAGFARYYLVQTGASPTLSAFTPNLSIAGAQFFRRGKLYPFNYRDTSQGGDYKAVQEKLRQPLDRQRSGSHKPAPDSICHAWPRRSCHRWRGYG